MNLIKKTIILTKGTAEGYVSVIRVGSDVGAKIVGTSFEKGMHAGVKIGRNDLIFAVLDGAKTEINLENVSFHPNDAISCVIMKGDSVVARGGNGVKAKDISAHFSALNSLKKEAENESTTTIAEVELQSAADKIPESKLDDEKETEGADKSESGNIVEQLSSEEPDDGAAKSLLEKLSAKDGAEFYNGIKDKLDELFVVNPREETLSALIPDSEWVKITYDGDDYYVVGKIYENNRPVLLGYGVPGKRAVTPPKIADEIASWMTVNELNNGYDGYWLIFQDAVTGKVAPVN